MGSLIATATVADLTVRTTKRMQAFRPASQMRMQHSGARLHRARRVRRKLGDRALAESGQNLFAHAPQGIADVALQELLALSFVGRARRNGYRTINGLDDVGH